VFDAESPFTPRGCIAQAWSVAEVLRTWMKVGMSRPREDDKQIREVASTAMVDRRVQAGASR
jgi:glycogen debranching enzyme